MTITRLAGRGLAGACAALILGVAAAAAHHGWNWAEAEQSTLSGTIETISVAPPHPGLTITAEDGTLWEIDLGNPRQTERSGFTAETASPGDAVTVLGNRSLDPAEMLMKAVRITIDGVDYDMYPERIPSQ